MRSERILASQEAIRRATTGDVALLQSQLAEADVDPRTAEQLVQVASEPRESFLLLAAVGDVASVRRGLVGTDIALLYGSGDDEESRHPLLVAGSGSELLHLVLAGLGFGARRSHAASSGVELDDEDDGFRIAMGKCPLPDTIAAPLDRPIRWWSLLPGTSGDATTVLDAADLWLQRGRRLEPIGPVDVWQRLSELLASLGRLEDELLNGEDESP